MEKEKILKRINELQTMFQNKYSSDIANLQWASDTVIAEGQVINGKFVVEKTEDELSFELKVLKTLKNYI